MTEKTQMIANYSDEEVLTSEDNSKTHSNHRSIDSSFGFMNMSFDLKNRSEDKQRLQINDVTFGYEACAAHPVTDQSYKKDSHFEVIVESMETQPKRPILKKSGKEYDVKLEYTSAPGDRGWYQKFSRDTGRYPKDNNNKHVRWGPAGEDQHSAQGSDSDWGRSNGLETEINGEYERTDRWFGRSTNFWNRSELKPISNEIVESLSGILAPVVDNTKTEMVYLRNQWNNNMEQFCSRFKASFLFPDSNPSIWSNDSNGSGYAVNETNPDDEVSKVKKIIDKIRENGPKTDASYTWSGQLPRRVRTKNPIYSCKVFLGGIPYDLTDSDLHCTFAQFGHIQIQWPGKDIRSAIDGAAANKAGYVYLIFEAYDNVAALLNSCTISYRDLDTGCRYYYEISSRRQKGKEVQVIPFDIGDRFYMKNSFSGQMEHSRTVFVGALHGMLTAEGLAKVIDDLFGGVVFAGLDTDKHKYPLGSGRVSFDNQDSYLKAVTAAFVEIKSNRFKKKIQIDPYIENESMCSVCRVQQQSPVFCRDDFAYFCHKCWDLHHSDPESAKHRPIIKNKPSTA